MPTADQLDPSKSKLTMLFKGSPGFGKTLAAASLAVEGPVWIGYFDKKEPVELVKFFKDIIKRPELLKNITYNTYSAENAHEYLNKLYELQDYCQYFAIVTDSLTTLSASAINWALAFRGNNGKMDKLHPKARATDPGMEEYISETSYATQALDVCRGIKAHSIWTAHPLPKLDMSGGGNTGERMTVKKTSALVSYGNKVGSLVPGQFTEIYHFHKASEWDQKIGKSKIKYLVSTDLVGDEMAKTALNLPPEFEITDRLFWEVWKENLK